MLKNVERVEPQPEVEEAGAGRSQGKAVHRKGCRRTFLLGLEPPT